MEAVITQYTFDDEVDWEGVSLHEYLTEDFIREFADKVDWDLIIIKQQLSEPFIREFKDKVDWWVSRGNKISANPLFVSLKMK
jgi:hypothetical protein